MSDTLTDRELIGKLAIALGKAQAAFPPIPRSRVVNVRSDKASYTFHYASLDAILDAVRPALAANGLAISQIILDGEIRTILIHESGAILESRMKLPERTGRMQDFGIAISYLRRYALQPILGIAAEDDADGNAPGTTSQRERERHVQAPARRPIPRPATDADKRPGSRSVIVTEFDPKTGATISETVVDELPVHDDRPDIAAFVPPDVPATSAAPAQDPADHVPTSIAQITGNPPVPKTAVRTGKWQAAAYSLGTRVPYYRDTTGKISHFHMIRTAAKLGFAEITDDNVAAVVLALEEYARIRTAERAQKSESESESSETGAA